MLDHGYEATLSGVSQMFGGLNGRTQDLGTEDALGSYISQKSDCWSIKTTPMIADNDEALVLQPSKSSRVHSLKEHELISEDIISVHSVTSRIIFTENFTIDFHEVLFKARKYIIHTLMIN